jgi:heme exporter protein B
MTPHLSLLKRELTLSLRQRGEMAGHLVFVLLIVTLFPFALGSDAALLQKLAAGLLLIAVLLGQMLGFERLFAHDYHNGTLDIIAGSHLSLSSYALIKGMTQWLSLMLPLLIMSPLLMLLLHVAVNDMPHILIALLLSSLTIQLLGGLGAALSLGAKRAGLLLPLLLIPFYIPVMIFAVAIAVHGDEAVQATYFLCALLMLYLTLLPYLTGRALRSALESL